LLSLVNQLSHTVRAGLEIAAGAAMALAAWMLWRERHRLAEKDLPNPSPQRKSSVLLGATIIAVELPTAFAYFAAIAAVVGSGQPTSSQLVALVLYNVCFVLPLMAILATILLGGEQAERRLSRARTFVQRRWPAVLAGVLLTFGLFVTTAGVSEFL
jgi:threonine/homoserine/homoserine lactone efflux protein